MNVALKDKVLKLVSKNPGLSITEILNMLGMPSTARTQLVRICDNALAKGELVREHDNGAYRFYSSSRSRRTRARSETKRDLIEDMVSFVREQRMERWKPPVIKDIENFPLTLSKLIKYAALNDVEQDAYNEINKEVDRLTRRLEGVLTVARSVLEKKELWSNKASPSLFDSFKSEDLYNLALEVEAIYG